MYSFEGDYKRTPQQSLGGASQNTDRETLIKKAQYERQKRAELRKQNDGATIIQSYARSFMLRQRIKEEQRQYFDKHLANNGGRLNDVDQLEPLLKRILFFYYQKNEKDGERLVGLSPPYNN